jgi:hypothetical protein
MTHAPALSAQIVDLSDGHDLAAAAPIDGEIVSADIMSQIATARRFPRSVTRFRKAVLAQVTLNQEIASQCSYAIKRDGKVIEGPSVRFAEVLAASWGNLRVGSRVVEEGERMLTAEGLAWDLETNTAIAMQTRRRITTKDGRRYGDDMIVTTGNAAASIALRNAVLRAVPKALWNDLWLQAQAVALGDIKTLAQRRNNAMAAFRPFGVTEAQICAALCVGGLADISLEHLATLSGFLNAITQEGVDPEEIFPPAETKAARQPPPPPDPKAKPAQSSPAPADKAPTSAKSPPPASTHAAAGGGSPPSSPPSQFELDLEVAVEAMIEDAGGLKDLEALPAFFASDLDKCTTPDWRERLEKMMSDASAAKARA